MEFCGQCHILGVNISFPLLSNLDLLLSSWSPTHIILLLKIATGGYSGNSALSDPVILF